MPNIPLYNASDPESVIRISDLGAEAWANAARNIGRLGQEGAARTEAGFKAAATGLKEFGEKIQEHQDSQDSLKLVNGLSDLEARHDQEINALKTDPNISPNDLPGRLAQTYQSHLSDLSTFGKQFDSASDKLKLKLADHLSQQRLQTQRKFEADNANASGAAAEFGLTKTFNQTVAGLGTNPSPLDVDRALQNNDNARQAALGIPGLNFDQREKINKLYDERNDQLAKSGVTSMINQDPSKLGDYYQRYDKYITPGTRTELESHARAIGKQKAGLAVHEDADSTVNQLLGGPPGQAPGTSPSPTPQTFTPPTGKEVTPGPRSEDDPRGKIPVIRYWASQNGVNPDTAVAVAGTEGLNRFKNPDEPSYTAFQLNTANGLGNKFQNETGLDPTLPENEDAAIKWTMENWRRNGGWEPFHGAANNGIGQWDGADNSYRARPTTNIASQPPRGASPIPPAVRGSAVATGDSIAAGLIRHGGITGKENRNALLDWSNGNTAAGGSPPSMVAENIKNLPDETFNGKPAILSTGASNAPQITDQTVQSIHDQIQTLKDKGATSITVLGTGSNRAFWNPKLQEIADQEKVTFSGPIKYTSDGIHPADYREFAHGIPLAQQSTGPAANIPIIDKVEDADFGDRFGQLDRVRGMIIHHTAGGGSVDGVINTFQQRGFPAHFVIDREGKVYQTLPDGVQGRHIITGSGKGEGLSNTNTLGVEIIANDDGDVLPVQRQAAAKLVGMEAAKYGFDPRNDVFGHGEVNPGHKEATEGMSVVSGIRNGELNVGGKPVQVAQAAPQTMTDASSGGGAPQTNAAAGAPSGANPTLPAYPSREKLFNDKMARMPDWVRKDPEYRTTYEEESHRFADDVLSRYKLRTGDEQKQLDNELKDGLVRLEKGEDFDYNENTIRHYFEPEVANQRIATLNEAKNIGSQIGKVRQTPVSEINSTMNSLRDSLTTADATDSLAFREHFKLVQAYMTAAERHLKGLGMTGKPDEDSKADPANYLLTIDPNLRQLYSQDLRNPENTQAYANAMLTRQSDLGVPEDKQHIIPMDEARRTALQIVGDPEHAANNLLSFYHKWGDNYQKAWSDMVTEGRLPEGYQLMATLDDPHDQFILARGLNAQATAQAKLAAGEAGNRSESFWRNNIGEKQYKAIQDGIRADDNVRKFRLSLLNAGASGAQVNNMMSAIDTLAMSKYAFDPTGNASTDDAKSYAVKAAIGSKYTWLGDTGRVPSNVYDSVASNTKTILDNMKIDDITVPKGFGETGQPSKDTYLALIKAKPTWITTRNDDGIALLDGAGRRVLDKEGKPIGVKFSDQKITPTIPKTPDVNFNTGSQM